MMKTEQIFPYQDSTPGALARLGLALDNAIVRGRRVLLDLDHLPELDNRAIRGLIVLLRRARVAGANLGLRVSRPEHRRVLRLTALDRLFEVAPC